MPFLQYCKIKSISFPVDAARLIGHCWDFVFYFRIPVSSVIHFNICHDVASSESNQWIHHKNTIPVKTEITTMQSFKLSSKSYSPQNCKGVGNQK